MATEKFICEAAVLRIELIEAQDRAAAALEFKRMTGTLADSVDGYTVVGQCEACGGILFEADGYVTTEDDCKLHPGCVPLAPAGTFSEPDGT